MNRNAIRLIGVSMSGFLLASCATINSRQRSEIAQYKAADLYVEEKKPGTAMALGLLPGGGSFYTRQYGMGVLDLLLWPISILWDPFNGEAGALLINYEETKIRVKNLKKKEVSHLDSDLTAKTISEEEYRRKLRAIEEKYDVN